MSRLVPVTYELAPKVDTGAATATLEESLTSGFSAFVIKQTGSSLRESLKSTGIGAALEAYGFIGDIRETVDFTYKAHNVLPAGYKQSPRPTGDGWYYVGITPLHADQAPALPLTKISVNHTRAGIAELLLHQALTDTTEWDSTGQWDILDQTTGDILWADEADEEVLVPQGTKAIAEQGDLWVFDASYLHLGRSLVTPRSSETMFFNKEQA